MAHHWGIFGTCYDDEGDCANSTNVADDVVDTECSNGFVGQFELVR